MGRLKSIVRGFLNSAIGCNVPRRKVIDQAAEYISFDIFDTLVVRDLSEPTELFRKIEQTQQIPHFAENRILAEKKARQKANGEVTIEDIYRCFPGVSEEKIPEYCRRELDMELQVCRANERIAEFYSECIRRKKVVLVSDMYLPTAMMSEIIDHCGITGYEKIYISCDEGTTKRSGGLYDAVLKDLGITADRLTHIGNDFMGDYICAKRRKIRAVKIKTKRG